MCVKRISDLKKIIQQPGAWSFWLADYQKGDLNRISFFHVRKYIPVHPVKEKRNFIYRQCSFFSI